MSIDTLARVSDPKERRRSLFLHLFIASNIVYAPYDLDMFPTWFVCGSHDGETQRILDVRTTLHVHSYMVHMCTFINHHSGVVLVWSIFVFIRCVCVFFFAFVK